MKTKGWHLLDRRADVLIMSVSILKARIKMIPPALPQADGIPWVKGLYRVRKIWELSGIFVNGDVKWSINTFVTHTGRSIGPEVEKELNLDKIDDASGFAKRTEHASEKTTWTKWTDERTPTWICENRSHHGDTLANVRPIRGDSGRHQMVTDSQKSTNYGEINELPLWNMELVGVVFDRQDKHQLFAICGV